MTSELEFWNPNKTGTLIIGSPRVGTHFLEKIVCHHVGDSAQQHSEELLGDLSASVFIEKLLDYQSVPGYHTLIVNNSFQKMLLKAYPELLKSWHCIHITHQDKIRWFISWYMFFYHNQSEWLNINDPKENMFMHHGTKANVYTEFFSANNRIRLSEDDIADAVKDLEKHLIGYHIPVDETIDYQNLSALAVESVPWLGNQYPSQKLTDIFENAEYLEKILLAWKK